MVPRTLHFGLSRVAPHPLHDIARGLDKAVVIGRIDCSAAAMPAGQVATAGRQYAQCSVHDVARGVP